jgi:serine protease Do
MNKYTPEQLHELLELYSLDLLENSDKAAVEELLANDPQVRKQLNEHLAFIRLINHKAKKDLIHEQLTLIRKENRTTLHRLNDGLSFHLKKYWKTASVAASVACLASLLTFSIVKNKYDSLLISNNENLTKVANAVAIVANNNKEVIKKVKNASVQPVGDLKQSGTCFAITNNGYAITNAHVVNSSKDIYVYTADDVAHRANVVSLDAELDIAVLKIDEADFKFSAQGIPYGFDVQSNNIAERVFTVGYPKNSIVYSEGYISSEFGRNDDSSRYQMMLPSDPGVSGSPVFNAKGNVVAVINSRESRGSSTTYALKAKKLNDFLKGIEDLNISRNNSLNNLSRAQQIKRVKNYVYIVKIF